MQDTEQQWEESHQVRRLMCIIHCTPPAQTDNTPAPQALKQLAFSRVAHPSTPTEKGHSLLRDGERRGESESERDVHSAVLGMQLHKQGDKMLTVAPTGFQWK